PAAEGLRGRDPDRRRRRCRGRLLPHALRLGPLAVTAQRLVHPSRCRPVPLRGPESVRHPRRLPRSPRLRRAARGDGGSPARASPATARAVRAPAERREDLGPPLPPWRRLPHPTGRVPARRPALPPARAAGTARADPPTAAGTEVTYGRAP